MKKNVWNKKGDICGSAVSILIICFETLHNGSRPGANITHNATWPPSDITLGNLSDYMQLPLEQQKALYYCFTYAVVLPKTCKHTLTSEIGGVTL